MPWSWNPPQQSGVPDPPRRSAAAATGLGFDGHLRRFLSGRLSLLVCDTVEEQRLLARAQAVCAEGGWRVLAWDAVSGFVSVTDHADNAVVTDPLAALDRVGSLRPPALVVMKDLHALWEEPRVRRAVRNTAQKLRGTAVTMLVVGHGASVPADLSDEALPLELELPVADDLRAALRSLAAAPHSAHPRVGGPEPQVIESLVQAALGLTQAQAERVFAACIAGDGTFSATDVGLVAEEKQAIVRRSGLLELYPATERPEDVGGLEHLKAWLALRGRAFTPEAAEFGLPAPKGVALIGIPGTGKSLSAKLVSGLWGLPLLRLDVGALFGSYIGQSEERVGAALRLAESLAPSVLWIDELEKALAHGGNDSGTSTRVFGTILTWMQEKTAPCFVVATANDISSLPPELLRRGRFDEVFFLDLPTGAERRAITEVHLRRRGRDPEAFNVDAVAAATEGFVGAEIEQVVIDGLYAAFDAGHELTTDDLLEAAGSLVPLAVSQREGVAQLRRWLAEGRATSASAPDAGARSSA